MRLTCCDQGKWGIGLGRTLEFDMPPLRNPKLNYTESYALNAIVQGYIPLGGNGVIHCAVKT